MNTANLLGRNLRSSPFRTAVVVLTVTVVVALTFSASLIGNGVRLSTEVGAARLGADMMLLPPFPPDSLAESYQKANYSLVVVPLTATRLGAEITDSARRLPQVLQASPQLYVTTFNGSTPRNRISLIAFDPGTDFVVAPWLSPAGSPLEVSGSEAIAGANTGLSKGGSLFWGGQALRVVAVLPNTNTSLDRSVFFPLETAYRAVREDPSAGVFKAGEITGVMIRLQKDVAPESVGPATAKAIRAFTLVEATALAQRVALETRGVATFELLVGGVIAVAFVLLIGSLFSMVVNERKRQVGVIRSLGATRRFIFLMMIAEMSIVALVGAAIGLLVGEVVSIVAAGYLHNAFQVSILQPATLDLLAQAGLSLSLGVGVGLAAAAVPSVVASSLEPYEAMRKGE